MTLHLSPLAAIAKHANEDLVGRLALVARRGQQVRKVKAHQNLALIHDPAQLFVHLGNNIADEAAKAAITQIDEQIRQASRSIAKDETEGKQELNLILNYSAQVVIEYAKRLKVAEGAAERIQACIDWAPAPVSHIVVPLTPRLLTASRGELHFTPQSHDG